MVYLHSVREVPGSEFSGILRNSVVRENLMSMNLDIDRVFFQELAGMEPAAICRRALCSYDNIKKCYIISAWGSVFQVYPESAEIIDTSGKKVTRNSGLPVLFYLLRGKESLIIGEWITEKDIPGGVVFFTGPHAIPSSLVAEKVENDIEKLQKACKELGGEEGDLGDTSCIFRILPRIPVAVVYWLGDDEFKPEAKLLFDRTIGEHLPLDVIYSLSYELLRRISQLYEE
jgi:hypothetical protein